MSSIFNGQQRDQFITVCSRGRSVKVKMNHTKNIVFPIYLCFSAYLFEIISILSPLYKKGPLVVLFNILEMLKNLISNYVYSNLSYIWEYPPNLERTGM